jgi:GxxExxY protein
MQEPDRALDDLAHAVIGAAIEVHRTLGPGFLESVYEQALSIEFESRSIPYIRQPVIEIQYKGHPIGEGRLDFLVADRLVVELKAVEQLAPIHTAQVMPYLKATGHHLGLLINFDVPVLKEGIKRVVLTRNRAERTSSFS